MWQAKTSRNFPLEELLKNQPRAGTVDSSQASSCPHQEPAYEELVQHGKQKVDLQAATGKPIWMKKPGSIGFIWIH